MPFFGPRHPERLREMRADIPGSALTAALRPSGKKRAWSVVWRHAHQDERCHMLAYRRGLSRASWLDPPLDGATGPARLGLWGKQSWGVPAPATAYSRIAHQRGHPFCAARSCYRRAAASAQSKPVAGWPVPQNRCRRASNFGPDCRRALRDSAALIRSCLARISGAVRPPSRPPATGEPSTNPDAPAGAPRWNC